MLHHLIVILDSSAPSFCHYSVPDGEASLMPLETLREAIYFAQSNALAMSVLVGERPLPEEYLEVLDSVNHIFIGPSSATFDEVHDVTVTDADGLTALPENRDKNIVLRLSRGDISRIPELIAAAGRKCRRVNLVFSDLPAFGQEDFGAYSAALKVAAQGLDAHLQVNVLTDRKSLETHRHCDAGVGHMTIGPDGKFYICPAFYYDGDSAGNLSDHDLKRISRPAAPEILDAELLRLDHAPLCRRCDAYACRRCVWLNRKLTRELNVPSHRQCVLAHIERNASLPDSPTSYLDPFEVYEK